MHLLNIFTLILLTFLGILQADRSFYIDYANNQFIRDGKPFRYISGSVHYFRIRPEQWDDRLKAVRAAGLNAIQTYIPWNFHETYQGVFNLGTSWDRNFTLFFEIAAKYELAVIVRPGPYICGEWENGGLPHWLLSYPSVKLRSSEQTYLNAALKWWDNLLPILRPQLWNNGGPIIMVQLENEYGSYGCDKTYKNALRDKAVELLGKEAVLFTTDPPEAIECGKIQGIFATVDFGERGLILADEYFAIQRQANNKSGPLVNSEFYPGWYQTWGESRLEMRDMSPTLIKDLMKIMYDKGASFNFYMFHGGTNFELWNGAEYAAGLITSYDYFAPLTEGGAPTDKYHVIHDFISQIPNWPNPPQAIPSKPKTFSLSKVTLTKYGNIHDFYNSSIFGIQANRDTPQSFEDLDMPFGLVSYTTLMKASYTNAQLKGGACKDFCYVYVNGNYKGRLSPNYHPHKVDTITIDNVAVGDTLEIIVESQGRLTWETIIDHKGLIGNDLSINGESIVKNQWTSSAIDFGNLQNALQQQPANNKFVPGDIFIGQFDTPEPNVDTYLDMSNWGKGFVWINGFMIGRYWGSAGPQKTLYIPYSELPWTLTDTIMILEMEKLSKDCIDTARFCNINLLDAPLPLK